MIRRSVAAAGFALSLVMAGAPAAVAQSSTEAPPGTLETTPLAPPGEAEAVEPDGTDEAAQSETAPAPDADEDIDTAADARAAHLDQLFGRLAQKENPDWQRVQSQIWAAWNDSGSDSMNLLARRADEAMEEKDFDLAMKFLNDLTRLAPDFAEGWNKRATLHFIREDYGPSLEDIAMTLRLEPRHFGALSGLGIILDRIGDKAGALEAYRRAVAVHPNLEGAQNGIKALIKDVEGREL